MPIFSKLFGSKETEMEKRDKSLKFVSTLAKYKAVNEKGLVYYSSKLVPQLGFSKEEKQAVVNEMKAYKEGEIEKAAKMKPAELEQFIQTRFGLADKKEPEKKTDAKVTAALAAKTVTDASKKSDVKATPSSVPAGSGVGSWISGKVSDAHAFISSDYRKERNKKRAANIAKGFETGNSTSKDRQTTLRQDTTETMSLKSFCSRN